MKPGKIYSQTKGNDVMHITADGKQVTADDQWFDSVVADWEHQGVDADLVRMARHLLDGTGKQQAAANRLLAKIRDHCMNPADAQMEMVGLLGREGVPMGRVPHMSEREFNAAWDDFSGTTRGKGSGDFSFGHSDKTRREAAARQEPGE